MKSRRRGVYMMDLLATVPYYTAYLSRALLLAGVPVQVGSISYYLDPQCFTSRGLPLAPGCMDLAGRFPRLPRPVRRIWKLLETTLNLQALSVRFLVSKPAVLHVQFLPMLRSVLPLDLWFVLRMKRRGIPVVLTVHDLLPHDTADRYREKFARLYSRMDALICHSGHIQQRLVEEFGVPPGRVHVIPHGPFFYDLPGTPTEPIRRALGIPAAHKVVLWQGIIFPYKGLDFLLEAWRRVECSSAEATLVVAGTGAPELLDALREQVRRLGLAHIVLDLRFASTEELVALYRAADVVVYPYRAITTSGALATGLALGKAMVASRLPVFAELLEDGVEALLVDPTDPEVLAAAMLRLLRDDALRARFSEAVRRRDFGAKSWTAITAKTLAVYREVTPEAGWLETSSPEAGPLEARG